MKSRLTALATVLLLAGCSQQAVKETWTDLRGLKSVSNDR